MRKDEKARVCYLIFLMGETLSKPDREKWKEEIMKLLEIDIKYYKSKYKAPVPRTDLPSDSNQISAVRMQWRSFSQKKNRIMCFLQPQK